MKRTHGFNKFWLDRKKKKAKKTTRAATAKGGAHLESKATRDKRIELENLNIKFAELKKEKVFNRQAIAQQEVDEYTAAKELLEAQLRKLEIKDQPYAGQAGTASCKKKKGKNHVKLPLSKEQQDQLKDMVSKHAKKVRDELEIATTHAEYSANLHKEFESFAKRKLDFYNGLPDCVL
jgi:hypothetical protein